MRSKTPLPECETNRIILKQNEGTIILAIDPGGGCCVTEAGSSPLSLI